MAKKTVQTAAKKSENRVDYYPNRMGWIVAILAAVSLVVIGLIAAHV